MGIARLRKVNIGGLLQKRTQISTGFNQYVHLDMIRGLAALAVFLGHLRALTFLDYAQSNIKGLFTYALYLLTGLGHQAVMIFFVLSGFFISRSIVKACDRDNWSWRNYMIQRLCRLWVVLLPALVFTFAWDRLGLILSNSPFLYTGAHSLNVISRDASSNLGAATFFGNFFFLQTILFPAYGTNGPLWSLANEFWYYIMFPLVYATFRGTTSLVVRTLQLSAAFALIWFLPGGLLVGFGVWLMGFGVYLISQKDGITLPISRTFFKGVTFVVFICFLGLSRFHLLIDLASDVAVGLSFAMFMCTLLRPSKPQGTLYLGLSTFLSNISYSLYVFHFPFCVFIASALLRGNRFQPSIRGIGLYVALCSFVILYTVGAYLLFEARTDRIRNGLFKRESTKHVAAASAGRSDLGTV